MMPFNIPVEKLPEKGLFMAYFKDCLVFETYEVKDGRIVCESSALLEKELPEEGHFFNETMEYRFVVRKSRKDVIELLLTEDEEIKIAFVNAKSPCFIRDDDMNYMYLILPVNFSE